jgi:hypothetical protein
MRSLQLDRWPADAIVNPYMLRLDMTHDIRAELRRKAVHLNGAATSLLHALEQDLVVVEAHLQDAKTSGEAGAIQRQSEERDRFSRDLDVLRDQMPILERLAGGGARQGREADALDFVDKLARALLLAVDDIGDRARRALSPVMIERLPAWEVESARALAADAEHAAILLKRALDDNSSV